MGKFDDATDLIDHCKKTLEKIRKEYDDSLHEKSLKASLLIEIKNFMENLRSALDFTAHGLFEKYGDQSKKNNKIYFTYAWEGLSLADFKTKKIIDQKIPELPANRPDIESKIESYQYFADPNNSWLPKFMDLNNENKHQHLTPQTRKEIKELKISSGGASISLGEGASISVGSGASIQIGGVTIPGGQSFDVNNPARLVGSGKQEILIWVSFTFTSNNELVLPLLSSSLSGVEKIVSELKII
jgi:hypothetical protein